jgi:energy-coupling factor transporter transmembrane protein EcfT
MPTLLSDPPPVALVVFGVLVLVAGGLCARYRKRPLLAVFTLLTLLFLAWVTTALLVESPREEAIRRVNAMADAVTAKDWAKFSENVSESFDWSGKKKADLKGYFDQAGQSNARAAAWNFDLTDPPVVTDTEVRLRFDAVAEGSGKKVPFHFHTTFVKDPDGKFRMRGFESFDYIQKNQPAPFP